MRPNPSALAKTSRPRLFGVVDRERLFCSLDENRGRPVIWIHGPPGAGKTSLVATYVENRNLKPLWLQVDAGDTDPASLFHYLAAGIGVLAGTDNSALPRFSAEHLADVSSFARFFFRSLFSLFPNEAIVVFDNCQEAAQGGFLHEILATAAEEVPPEGSIVCISRTEPPPALIPAIAKNAVARIGWDQLRLRPEEIVAIASRRGVNDATRVSALQSRSDGWAAGLTLLLESSRMPADGSVSTLDSRDDIFEYFARIDFDQATQATRQILMSVAFVPRVSAAAAIELSGSAFANEVLESYYRRGMFTERRSASKDIYQFHSLFSAFLQSRAREFMSPVGLASLLVRSADLLERSGETEAAVDIRLANRQWDAVVRTILAHGDGLLRNGRRQTLVRWIQELPGEFRESTPRVLLLLGRAQLESGPVEGTRTLIRALDALSRSDDRIGRVECLATLLGGAFLGFHALETMDQWLDNLLAEVEDPRGFGSVELETRIWGVLAVTLFHVRPWHQLTFAAYRKIEDLLPDCSDSTVALGAAMHALVVSGLCGDFECGDRIAAGSRHLAVAPTASPTDSAWWFAQLAWLRLFEARYEESFEAIDCACRIAEANGLKVVMRQTILWRITVQFRTGAWPEALASLDEVEAMPKPTQPMVDATLQLFRARKAVYLKQDCAEEAMRYACLSQNAAMRTRSRLEEVIFCLCNADVLLEVRSIDQADTFLKQIRPLIERTPAYGCYEALLLFMEARCLLEQGNRAQALIKLRAALVAAGSNGGQYYFRLCDWSVLRLFQVALEEGIEAVRVRDLIRLFRLKAPKGAGRHWPWPIRIQTLGGFEVVVDDAPLQYSRKVPKKPLALLKALISLGGRDVPEETLCDLLWTDDEGDDALEALGISVSRLRKLIGRNDALSRHGGKISLDRSVCWVDAWEFEERFDASRDGIGIEVALNSYRGNFLPDDEDLRCTVSPRERMRGRFIHLLATHGKNLEKGGEIENAIGWYLRGIQVDSIVEAFHQGLMRCYRHLGRHTEAASVYRSLRRTLSIVLGIAPSTETRALYEDILRACPATGSDDGTGNIVTIGRPGRKSAGQKKASPI